MPRFIHYYTSYLSVCLPLVTILTQYHCVLLWSSPYYPVPYCLLPSYFLSHTDSFIFSNEMLINSPVPLISLWYTVIIRPCCYFLMTMGELAPPRTTILGLRDFSHFSTEFIMFTKYFNSFQSRAAVLRFREKFK